MTITSSDILPISYHIIECVVLLGVTNTIHNCRYIYNQIRTFDYTMFAYNVVTTYSKVVTKLKATSQYLYDEYPAIRYTVDRTIYGARYLYASLYGYRIEPFYPNWISISAVQENRLHTPSRIPNARGSVGIDTDKSPNMGDLNVQSCNTGRNRFELIEEYVELPEMGDDDLLENIQEAYRVAHSTLTENVTECLLTIKYDGQYMYYVCSADLRDPPITANTMISSAAFINVQYVHPRMHTGVYLNMDRNLYLINNELFSPTFVRRWLDYQPDPFYFDMNYKLKILTADIQSIELKSHQFILMKKTKHQVCPTDNQCIVNDSRQY